MPPSPASRTHNHKINALIDLRLRRRAEGGEGGRSGVMRGDSFGPSAWRADRHEGLFRFQAGLGHDLRRHPRAQKLCRQHLLHVRRAHGEGRRDLRRQDQQPGLRLSRHLRQLSVRTVARTPSTSTKNTGGSSGGSAGAVAAGLLPFARAPTAAARSASQRPGAASMATSPPSAACRW